MKLNLFQKYEIRNEYDCDYTGNSMWLLHPINRKLTRLYRGELLNRLWTHFKVIPNLFIGLAVQTTTQDNKVLKIGLNYGFVENLKNITEKTIPNQEIIQTVLDDLFKEKGFDEDNPIEVFEKLSKIIPEISVFFEIE